jgi:hypothetical protein
MPTNFISTVSNFSINCHRVKRAQNLALDLQSYSVGVALSAALGASMTSQGNSQCALGAYQSKTPLVNRSPGAYID